MSRRADTHLGRTRISRYPGALSRENGRTMISAKQMARLTVLMALIGAMGACASIRTTAPDIRAVQADVDRVERAFAQSMADRDVEAFMRFVSADAVFMNGGQPLRGPAAIRAEWAPFFSAPTAPFSWSPAQVEVLDSGDLAHTTGDVLDPAGRKILRFHSVWRLEADGQWRVIFDAGDPVPRCDQPPRAADSRTQ
jgi:uncharacterized protein (TIGR02246 family)